MPQVFGHSPSEARAVWPIAALEATAMRYRSHAHSARVALLVQPRATEAQQIEFVKELLRAPSANPPGETRPAAAVITRFLERAGITAWVIAARPE